jgi:predicted DnaQ family exonuclease/DinG family helicase
MNKKEILSVLNLSTYVAFDFETTGLNPKQDRIIEFAAIRFVHGKPKKRYSTLINPGVHVSPFITGITGISNQMVSTAPNEEDIIDDLFSIIGKYPLVAHNIRFDWNYLLELCKRYNKDIPENPLYDTLQLARAMLFDHPVFNLGALSEFYGLDSSGSHRAEKDTENCGNIFIYLLDELSEYTLEEISRVISVIEKYDIPNKKLYVDLANALLKKGDLKGSLNIRSKKRKSRQNIYQYEGPENIQNITAAEVFGSGGILSKNYDWYEDRINQVEYANMCDKIINSTGSGVLEAGTGLGKSMGYLFAAIKRKYETEERGPVVIGCNTKHLQDQLFFKDLPQLTNALKTSVTALLIKGRKNYICRTRFNWAVSERNILSDQDIEAIIPILFWLERTQSGDVSECNGFLNTRKTWIWSMICSDMGFCTGNICRKNHGCFYGPIRKLMYEADIIVANHSLLLSEAKSPGILPEHDTIIIDEVHNLVRSGYDQFKVEIDHQIVLPLLQSVNPSHPRSRRWNNILNSISDSESSVKMLRESLLSGIEQVRISFEKFMDELTINNEDRFNKEKTYQERPIIHSLEKEYASINSELARLKTNIQSLLLCFNNLRKFILEIDSSRTKYLYLHNVLDRGLENISGLSDSINILTENQDSEWVYWKQGIYHSKAGSIAQLRLSLHASMVDISEILRNKLYRRNSNFILTSATIKVDDSFDYFFNRNGLRKTDNIITDDYISPFSYQDQVVYYQYGGTSDITGDPSKLSDIIYYIHKTFQKRTMVLFTSIKMLENVSKKIKEKSDSKDIPLFAQSKGASKLSIIKGMHMHKNALLFGTNSFWEGVDLPGELLEILIVVKLPFGVPTDPLIKSYSNFLDSSGVNSFMNFSVPECAIRFRQGFGRLIRTTYDSGIFISLDNRIVTKRYGEFILNNIPTDPIIFSDYSTIKK